MTTALALRPVKPQPIPYRGEIIKHLDVYETICNELGYHPHKLMAEQIVAFCNENDIPVLRYSEVRTYMNKIVPEGKGWAWYGISKSVQERFKTSPTKIYAGVYTRLIPVEHLRNAKKIKERFPTTEILVTDYHDVNPDPFIAVMNDGFETPIVFGVWDEPNFGNLT